MAFGDAAARLAALDKQRQLALQLMGMSSEVTPQVTQGIGEGMREYRSGERMKIEKAREGRDARRFKDEQIDRDRALDKSDLSTALSNVPDDYSIPSYDPVSEYDRAMAGLLPGEEVEAPGEDWTGGLLGPDDQYEKKAAEIEANLSPKSPKDFEQSIEAPSDGLSAGDFGVDTDNNLQAQRQIAIPPPRQVNPEALADLIIADAKSRNPNEEYDRDIALEVANAHIQKIREAEKSYREGLYAERERRRQVQRDELEDQLKRVTMAGKIEDTKKQIRENTLGKGPSAEQFQNHTMPFVERIMDGARLSKEEENAYTVNQFSRAELLVNSLAKEVGAEKSGGKYSPEDQAAMLGALNRRAKDNTKEFEDEGAKAYFGRLMTPGESAKVKASKNRKSVTGLQDSAYSRVENSVGLLLGYREQLDRLDAKGINTGKFPGMMGQVAQWFGVDSPDWTVATAQQKLEFVRKARDAMPGVLSNQDIALLSMAMGNDLDEDSMRAVTITFHDAMERHLHENAIPKIRAYDDDGRFDPLIAGQLKRLEKAGGAHKTYRFEAEMKAAKKAAKITSKHGGYVIIKPIGGNPIMTDNPEAEMKRLERAGINYITVTNKKILLSPENVRAWSAAKNAEVSQ